MSTLIYLGMLAVVSIGMYVWGRMLFNKVKDETGVTPPGQGRGAEARASVPMEAESKQNSRSSAAAGGSAKSANHEERAA